MLGEIGQRQRAADGGGAGHDAASEIAAIELLTSTLGDRRQRRGQIGLDEAAVGESIRMIDGPERAYDFGWRTRGEER